MKFRHALLAALLTTALVAPAYASSVLVTTPQRFTKLANTIAHIKVEKTESYWQDNRIVTKVTARVIESIKGSRATEVITFIIPGGKIGNLEAISTGTPTIEANEELVVYLENGHLGHNHLLGQSMGLYRLRYDKVQGQYIARRDISQLGLISASPEVQVETMPRVRELKLTDLLKEIKTYMAEVKE